MPKIKTCIRVGLYRLIDIGITAVNAGDIFFISEPHFGGGRLASYIVKSIIEKAGKPGKLILEAPHSLQDKAPTIIEKHIKGTQGYSLGVDTLPTFATERQWSLFCVDIENQLSYSSERQDFIASNIVDALTFNPRQGTIVLFGWNHMTGRSSRLVNVTSFKKYLTDSTFRNERVYEVENIKAHIIGRRELRI